MVFIKALGALALVAAATASPVVDARAACTAKYRIDELNGVAPAFSGKNGGAAPYLQQLPLKDDAKLTIYINGSPGITPGQNAALVRDFAFGVSTVFYDVYPTSHPASTDYGNGTTHTELEIELGDGIIHTIEAPINIHAGMNFNWDLSDCKLTFLQGFLTVPSEVLGQPIDTQAIIDAILAAGKAGKLPSA